MAEARGVVGARVLDRAAAAAEIGSDTYFGAWFDPRGGAVRQLDYRSRTGRAAAPAIPARPCWLDPVTDVVRQGDACTSCASGASVRADRVLRSAPTPIPAHCCRRPPARRGDAELYQVATEAAAGDVAATIPEGRSRLLRRRRLLAYFRLDHTRLAVS